MNITNINPHRGKFNELKSFVLRINNRKTMIWVCNSQRNSRHTSAGAHINQTVASVTLQKGGKHQTINNMFSRKLHWVCNCRQIDIGIATHHNLIVIRQHIQHFFIQFNPGLLNMFFNRLRKQRPVNLHSVAGVVTQFISVNVFQILTIGEFFCPW